MSITELKYRIIHKIASVEDKEILEGIFDMIERELPSAPMPLSEEERIAIDAGLLDVKEGRLYSSASAEQLLREWRKK